jgi:hypothetical protein
MSSEEYKSILDSALNIVSIRCRNLRGADRTLGEIRRRAERAKASPALVHERFFEPWDVSQRLNVPIDTVRSIAGELLRIGILHVWVRVRCPNVPETEENVLVETDNPETLRQQLDNACRYCSQPHRHPAWDQIEMVYALNLDDKEPKEFDLDDFFASSRLSQMI